MTAIPSEAFQGRDREHALIRVLNDLGRSDAYDLMPRIGLFWGDTASRMTAFISFLNVYLRARKILERYGLTIERTNHGTPAAEYWIEQVRSS